MGLSASQARLLSITQRINNNELQSEIIANAKMQLSTKNTIASEKYINALDDTKLEYISYDDTGSQERVNLTFNSINQYTPLKNQYALFNNENQIYVNATDANNFQTSTNLYEFLDKYGLFDEGRGEFEQQMADYNEKQAEYEKNQQEYDKQLGEFNDQFEDYSAKLEEYNQKLNEYNEKYDQYLIDLEEYETLLNAPKLYSEFTNAVIGNGHYTAAQGNDPGCFLHVLNNLLDYNGSVGGVSAPYTTSATNADGSPVILTSLWENNYYNMPALQNTSSYMTNEEEVYVCDGLDVGAPAGKNLYQVDREAGNPPSVYTQLASDFIETQNPDGTYSYTKKTLRQKTIDMYYLIANSVEQKNTRSSGSGEFQLARDGVTVSSFLTNFVEGDMKGLDPEEPTEPTPPDPFEEEPPVFNLAAPQPPEKPIYTEKIYDKPLAQWYTNLWYIMDGSTTSDEVYSVYDEQADFDYFTVPNQPKTSTLSNNNYVVIDDSIASNPNWLQFALNNGLVTISQAGLRNETHSTNITWKRTEFTSTSDIYEVQDDTKIAKAEAEYQKTMTEIQIQDKQYDIQLKKLDTEHSALGKEYESIKGVMDKNTERSFTAFS